MTRKIKNKNLVRGLKPGIRTRRNRSGQKIRRELKEIHGIDLVKESKLGYAIIKWRNDSDEPNAYQLRKAAHEYCSQQKCDDDCDLRYKPCTGTTIFSTRKGLDKFDRENIMKVCDKYIKK